MIKRIPVFNSVYQYWCNYSARKELNEINIKFEELIKKPSQTEPFHLKRAVKLLTYYKNNSGLKNELAKLERTYRQVLISKNLPLGPYLEKENCELEKIFIDRGISKEFLKTHPEFLSIARQHFWKHYFPFVNFPIQMIENNELQLKFECSQNRGTYEWKSWSDIKELDFDQFRITYKGFAIDGIDDFTQLVPLKEVNSNKYALQFVTSCPINKRLPSSIDLKASGHSFTQIIVPKEGSDKAEVYSVGFYPKKISDFGYQFFKTVQGVYRNHDSNVSRIQAKQVIPIVRQYVFNDDATNNPCLYALLNHMDTICDSPEGKEKRLEKITLEQIDRAMLDRNEPELDRIHISLTEILKGIIEKELNVPILPMTREEKTKIMLSRFEESKNHSYHILSHNCTAVSYQHEAFAVAFLGAKLDRDPSIKVYENQCDIQNHQFGIFDRIRDVVERFFLHFFAAMPLTGVLLGIGKTHPNAEHPHSANLVPSILTETASAVHKTLTAPFTKRPEFPAGELLSKNTPVIQPPGFFARLRYLLSRNSLLNPEFDLFGN